MEYTIKNKDNMTEAANNIIDFINASKASSLLFESDEEKFKKKTALFDVMCKDMLKKLPDIMKKNRTKQQNNFYYPYFVDTGYPDLSYQDICMAIKMENRNELNNPCPESYSKSLAFKYYLRDNWEDLHTMYPNININMLCKIIWMNEIYISEKNENFDKDYFDNFVKDKITKFNKVVHLELKAPQKDISFKDISEALKIAEEDLFLDKYQYIQVTFYSYLRDNWVDLHMKYPKINIFSICKEISKTFTYSCDFVDRNGQYDKEYFDNFIERKLSER